jgi:hypothetical protein
MSHNDRCFCHHLVIIIIIQCIHTSLSQKPIKQLSPITSHISDITYPESFNIGSYCIYALSDRASENTVSSMIPNDACGAAYRRHPAVTSRLLRRHHQLQCCACCTDG